MTTLTTLTVGTLRRQVAARLADGFAARGGDGTPALDARLLVAHAAGRDPMALPLDDDKPADEQVEARAYAFAERRIAGEPVARIVGHKEFWGLDFELTPETLVPRPDTETVVEAALGLVDRQSDRRSPLTVLDLGTGSGAILLALLSELPLANGVGVDIAEGALRTAQRNARRLGLVGRARFFAGDWAAAIGGRFDLVVANPPYVETTAVAGLALEVREHDPHLALDGGADGLDCFRAIVEDFNRLVAEDGAALLEIGAAQSESLAAIGAACGWTVRFERDLAGVRRVGVFERPKAS